MILLYIQFDKVFTYVGGMKSTSMSFSRNLIKSQDHSQDWDVILEQTGRKSFSVSGNGVLSDNLPKELFVRLINAFDQGVKLRCRIEELISNNNFLTLEGDFFISQFQKSDSIESPIEFNISLMSTGLVKAF